MQGSSTSSPTKATSGKRIGRPSSFNAEIAERICSFIAEGGNVNRFVQLPDTPTYETVLKWLKDYPSFAEDYARARELRSDARSDRIDNICERVLAGEVDPQSARVVIDAEKWQAAHEMPKRYGDRLELDGAVKHDGAFTLADVLAVVHGAKE